MSPAHLSRLPPQLETISLKQNCLAVFSSGAPLLARDARATEEVFGQNAIEVYGSSETGGIAYRQQQINSLWQPLPGVQLKTETVEAGAVLCIKSPHIRDGHWYVSADQVGNLSDKGFELGPRTDRIAKIGGKRISLTALELKLNMHPWVDQVKVTTLEEKGNRSAALVVLNSDGNNQLINKGKLQINQQLTQHLQDCVERIGIPRYWRYWDSIPCNRQGKTTKSELSALFSSDNKPQFPEVIETEGAEEQRLYRIFIPHNLSWFDGHFPGRPILPGVVQTHWAQYYGTEAFGNLGGFSHLEMIKFQQVIAPGKTIQLKLKWNSQKLKLSFSYLQGEQKLSSGRIAFKPIAAHAGVSV